MAATCMYGAFCAEGIDCRATERYLCLAEVPSLLPDLEDEVMALVESRRSWETLRRRMAIEGETPPMALLEASNS
jgi:hypothetical protein